MFTHETMSDEHFSKRFPFDIFEVLNRSDVEDLLCMLTDVVGVDRVDFDILHFH